MYELKDAEQYFHLKKLEISFIEYIGGQTTTTLTCVDKIFAIREIRLNPYIGFAQYAGGTGTIGILKESKMLGSEFSSAADTCLAKPSSTTPHNQIQIYLK